MTELDGQQVGTSPVASVNDPGHKNSQGLNSFDLSHYNALTARFGDVTPFLNFETAPRDSVRFANNHELRTLTLAAPLLSPVRMHKSYFFTPMKAIMPNTWELLIKNPKYGSDISDDYLPKCNLASLYYKVLEKFKLFLDSYSGTDGSNMTSFDEASLTRIALFRNVFSKGSLLRVLGYPYWHDDAQDEIDILFDEFISALFDNSNYTDGKFELRMLRRGQTWPLTISLQSTGSPVPLSGTNSVADLLNSAEHNFTLANASTANKKFPEPVRDAMAALSTALSGLKTALNTLANSQSGRNPDVLVSLAPLVAYHMSCAQFFSNDNVDDIDNGKLWLQNWTAMHPSGLTRFTLNGVSYMSDAISYDAMFHGLVNYNGTFAQNKWLLTLLCFEQSLKYGDYFNGSRTRPLAVGDVQIDVAGSSGNLYVEALDVTKNLAKQKFLNAVNKLSQNIAQYTKGIFGVATDAIDPQPQFVARSTAFIGNPETINTADDQGVITSQLSSIDGKFEFNAQFSDFGILTGVISFDVIPCYPLFGDKSLYHTDRFTFFNPMLQNIGDQPIKMEEINPDWNAPGANFGYQQRYAEYKNAVSRCSGGFALLPKLRSQSYYGLSNWLYQANLPSGPIDSEFIRHRRVDFDRFYSSIDGVSLATYVHFAIVFNQQLTANRAMQYQSTIL